MTTDANRARYKLRSLAPALSALIAAAGCGVVGGDETATVGLASIKAARVDITHSAGNMTVLFKAGLSLPGGPSCPPPLAPDFAITVNATPLQLSIPDGREALTFICALPEVEGWVTLPETGGPLDVELTQGERKASMVIARSAFPVIGPVAPSRTAVSAGRSFSVNVAVSGADGSERRQLALSGDWIASLCVPSGCVPGEGWIGMLPTNAGARDGGLGFDVVVPDTVPSGNWLLGVHLFQPSFAPTITECAGLPSCMASNDAGQTWDFGPFNFDVL